jgi:hypothetical protein
MYPEEEAQKLTPYSPAAPIFTTDVMHTRRALLLSDYSNYPCEHALKALIVNANAALKQKPLTIVNKPILPPSKDKHDYMSVGPYWWPDPNKPDGLPYIRRDGERNPEVEKTDRPLLAKLITNVKTLGLAYRFTQQENYATHAAMLLRTWFTDPNTKMNPNLLFGQAIPGICDGRGIGLIETAALARELLPAVNFIMDSPSWSAKDTEDLQIWFHAFLTWMLTHPYGVDEARHGNNHSNAYDVQVVTYALFVGQPELAQMILQGVGERRIAVQIEPNGKQPKELARTKALGYSSMNLELLLELAEIGRQWDVDLVNFESSDGRSLRRAFDWLLPYWTGKSAWTYPQIQPFPAERAFGCWRLAAHLFADIKLDPVNIKLADMDQTKAAQHIYNLVIPPFEGSRFSTPKVAEDVVVHDPITFEDPDFTNGEPTLSEAEVTFFKKNGFIIKRGLLDDRENFERIVNYVWENVPRNIVKRDDIQTWYDAPQGEWTEKDAEKLGLFGRGSWKMRSRYGIGTEPFLLDKIGNHPHMHKVVSLFIGKPVKRLQRVRGVYAVFPVPPDSDGRLAPHADHTSSTLSAMVIVDEIPPQCGGFTVWPGSHLIVHPFGDTIHGPISSNHAKAYAQARDDVLRNTTPVELSGQAGDVIFWHPQLMHSGGINRSANLEHPVLRLIVPCDYQQDGFTFFDNLVEGPGPCHQWWVDTRSFREDVPPTPDNIWKGWAFAT